MGVILSYSLFSSIVLMLLYLTYKWVMAGENQHTFNRVALWGIYLVALLAPMAVGLLHRELPVSMTEETVFDSGEELNYPMITMTDSDEVSPVAPVWPKVILCIYLAGVIAVAAHTLLVGFRLTRVIKAADVVDEIDGYRIVVTENGNIAPFSWCRYVVMNRKDYDENGPMILVHELRHLGLCHWVDLLLAQAVGIFQWFNPAAWLMREELKTVHEYQADNAVLRSGVCARDYQMLLISKALGSRFPSLANCLNHSKLKKRISMMYDERTSPLRRLRGLALVPALGVAFIVTDLDAVASVMAETASATFGNGESTEVADLSASDVQPVPQERIVVAGTEDLLQSVAEADKQMPATEPKAEPIDEDLTPSAKDEVKDAKLEEITVVASVRSGDDYAADASDDAPLEAHVRDSAPEVVSTVPVEAASTESASKSEMSDGRDTDNMVFTVVEKKPVFPTGESGLLRYIAQNLRYPADAQDAGIQGRVVIQFVIKKDGNIGDTRIMRSVHPSLDAEAVRVIKTLPTFHPGTINGQPVAVWYTLPVTFKLKNVNEVRTNRVSDLTLDGKALKKEGIKLYIDGVFMEDGDVALASLDPTEIDHIDVYKNPDKIFITKKKHP